MIADWDSMCLNLGGGGGGHTFGVKEGEVTLRKKNNGQHSDGDTCSLTQFLLTRSTGFGGNSLCSLYRYGALHTEREKDIQVDRCGLMQFGSNFTSRFVKKKV